MKTIFNTFEKHAVLQELEHFLPVNIPLKNFTHHHSLRAFSGFRFFEGLQQASAIFGYQTLLSLEEYRAFFNKKRITADILEKVIIERKGAQQAAIWRTKVLFGKYNLHNQPKIGRLRAGWKSEYGIDLAAQVHPKLFSLLAAYFDQGAARWTFPVQQAGFLASVQALEESSFASIFKTKRAGKLLTDGQCDLEMLLEILVGNPALYRQYLFDQQFAHPGWSGMVVQIQDQPEALLNQRKVTLSDLITLELLLEIDALDFRFGSKWQPLGSRVVFQEEDFLVTQASTEVSEVLAIWQEAFEWSYYDQVLGALKRSKKESEVAHKSFQAIFCMDNRECSLRRYVENFDSRSETFGTPGHFGLDFYYQPAAAAETIKTCPPHMQPRHLIKEIRESNAYISKTNKANPWTKFSLRALFPKSAVTPAAASFNHFMGHTSGLTIENTPITDRENDLQVGYSIAEMADQVAALLKSIGLVTGFAPIVYIIGHGAGSVNNPHFAALDCCACSGRPGSVNARVFAKMANHPAVRKMLFQRGIEIPEATVFVPALHDTTRDEITFFDEDSLSETLLAAHRDHTSVFSQALDYNAKERARRFETIDKRLTAPVIHDLVRKRAASVFRSRPELGQANNALCVIGRRSLTKNLFLDRRAFVHSYDYTLDPEGEELRKSLEMLIPLTTHINLEYFFSRVDPQRLGAGAHAGKHVVGLFGIENPDTGDLRRGLPWEMVETHDPVRLLFIIEQDSALVKRVILGQKAIRRHFVNAWSHLVVADPHSDGLFVFKENDFQPYKSYTQTIEDAIDISSLFESHSENLPVFTLH